MSFTQIGHKPFSHHGHESSNEVEAEYDRLRDLARQEHTKRKDCFDKAHEAYESGDGKAAHELSEAGKRHGAKMEEYNKQASEYIFRENNAPDRVDGDTIDLHGQFVEEAEDILEERIRHAQQHGQNHLHVIVGKGNHSAGHVQKIKPRVEKVCQELGLQYRTEENAGRIYVDLTGGEAHLPSHLGGGGQLPEHHVQNHGQQQHHQQQPHHQQQQHPQSVNYGAQHEKPQESHHHSSYADAAAGHDQEQAQPHHPQKQHGKPQGNYQQGYNNQYPGAQQQQQGQGQNDEIDEMVRKGIPKLVRALKGCCVVM
ncbi:smr domain-containing protein [Phyllosticta capitalensis]|uniref:Smr domain-containing protein n=1 Tax=Phyllosticta capitalensis TaxID=121624 RepID=A0ABR1YJX9_9PEZI